MWKPRYWAFLGLGAWLVSPVAFATNGYFAIGYGTAADGMGGAAVAYPQNSISAAANPADLSDVGTRFDIGVGVFDPRRCAGEVGLNDGSPNGSGGTECVKSGSNTYLVPGMGVSFAYNHRWSFGVAAVGNGGMDTTYSTNFFSTTPNGGGKLGVDLVQLFIPITVAWRPVDSQSFGFSLVPAGQRFAAQGLSAFTAMSAYPDNVTNQGHDYAWGLGARIGWLGHFLDDRLSLGATYATKEYMQKFTKYRGLFADGGAFDVPANYAVGIAVKVIPNKLDAALDVERILYADVPSVADAGPTSILYSGATINTTPLGASGGMGFGWQNQTVYKLGFLYHFNKKLILRAGYNYGKSPIPDSQLLFNLLAPGIVETHYTLGATYKLGRSFMGAESSLSFAWVYAKKKRQTATLLFEDATPVTATAEMFQNEWELAYGLKF